jgi:hypothetical protein
LDGWRYRFYLKQSLSLTFDVSGITWRSFGWGPILLGGLNGI